MLLKNPKEARIVNRFIKQNISHFNSLCIHRSFYRNFRRESVKSLALGSIKQMQFGMHVTFVRPTILLLRSIKLAF